MTRSPGRLARLPLRLRLVAGFSVSMLLVLTGAGGFVYWRVQHALDENLNGELSSTADALAPLVSAAGDDLTADAAVRATGDSYQVLDPDGVVLSADPPGTSTLLDGASIDEAMRHPILRNVGGFLPVSRRPLRVYARALERPGSPALVLVVAARRDQRDETLRELLAQLSLAGLAALVVTALVGDRLARAALRPVEHYRVQATEIASGVTGLRLDVPAERDDEITRLGHTLNEMLEALESALAHERRFVDDASHELRTPLTLLSSRVQLALRRPRSVDAHEEILGEIGTDIARLSTLAEQLLAAGVEQRIASNEDDADLSAVAVRESRLRHALAPPGSAFSPATALSVTTDGAAPVGISATRLGQVVGNLLDNAALHGRQPVLMCIDTVRVDGSPDAVRLTMSDAGAGMDADTIDSAPQRFSRSVEARARPGSGLGLSLVHSIVTGAGGELRLCFAGVHRGFGPSSGVPCEHDEQMTVTVLLPRQLQAVDGGSAR